jgi:hypothetical protein
MKEVMGNPHQLTVDIAAECEELFVGILKSLPGEVADLPRQGRFVKRQIARPERIPGYPFVFTHGPDGNLVGHVNNLSRGGIYRAGGGRP